VLRGLIEVGTKRQPRPPAIGKLVAAGPAGEVFAVKLRVMSAARWCPRARYVPLASFVRVATAREIAIGWPVDGTKEAA
jgi:hypothetical protein